VRRRWRTAALIAAAALAATCPAARADHGGHDLVKWPALLPPLPVDPGNQPHPVTNCETVGLGCVSDLARRLREQWQAFDATCDHRAVMALSYLYITEELERDIALPQPELVQDRDWMIPLITTFSNRYFQAHADHAAGRPVAEAWRIALDAAAGADVTAGQDVLLFSNAHVQHDLPYAIVEMGLVAPDGHSRKHDHDAVNEVNARILDPVEDDISERYDPTFPLVDLQPSPLDEVGSMEFVKGWREGAWRNAERLARADTAAERASVERSIDLTSSLWARIIAAPALPGFRATRDAHCRAFHAGP
jgi:hypothetical protein